MKYFPKDSPVLVVVFALLSFYTNEWQSQNLFFESGFGGSVEILQYEINGNFNPNVADIVGSDLGYDWITDLDNLPEIGNFRIFYEVGDTLKSKASIVNDPLNASNKVMLFELMEPNVEYISSDGETHFKGRVQSAIYDNDTLREFRNSRKLYIHPDFALLSTTPEPIVWFTIAEYWNNSTAEADFPFRITLNIRKEAGVGAPLHFGAHAQSLDLTTGAWVDVWDTVNLIDTIPLGEWITLEDYFFEGDENTGVYRAKIILADGSFYEIVNFENFTHHPDDPLPNGVYAFSPMKLYTSGELIAGMIDHCLCLYWDDYRLEIPGSPESTCLSDFDNDGNVGVSDGLILFAEFGCVSSLCSTDTNGDGAVTITDVLAFLSEYGSECI